MMIINELAELKKNFIDNLKALLGKNDNLLKDEDLWNCYLIARSKDEPLPSHELADAFESNIKILTIILQKVLSDDEFSELKPHLQRVITSISAEKLLEPNKSVFIELLKKAVLLDTMEQYKSKLYSTCLYKFGRPENHTLKDTPLILSLYDAVYKKMIALKQAPGMYPFYAEYAYVVYRANRDMKEDLNPLAVELCKKSIELKEEKNSAANLYLGYMHEFFPLHFSQNINESYDLAESYYEKSSQMGSVIAHSRLASLLKKKTPERWWELMNADENLSALTATIEKNKNFAFSMLLSGPHGSGQYEFAQQILDRLNIPYEEISLLTCALSGENNIYQKLQSIEKSGKAYIIEYSEILYEQQKYSSNYLPEKISYSLQTILKNNQLPIIFIADDINKLNINLRSCFMFRITFNYLDKAQKEVAYKLYFGIDAPDNLDQLSGLTLDDFNKAKRKAKVLGCANDETKIYELLKEEVKYKFNGNVYSSAAASFSDKLINSDTNLFELTNKLTRSEQTKFTMLIYGPPGTGKSYYLRYLAAKLGLDTLEKTAADLFSPYQGEPARKVKKMFDEAQERKAIIILDEVDEILKSRAEINSENGNWKIDMVNAFLTCLDQAQYPVVCTTNFVEKIDPAILRRFIFKLKFDYLTTEQNRLAFKFFFKQEPPKKLDEISYLTNGDYATVKTQSLLLDFSDDTEKLLEGLQQEVNAKRYTNNLYEANLLEFDKNLLNTDSEMLQKIETQLLNRNVLNLKIMLSGPAGSGKMTYAQYLVKLLNMNCQIYTDKDFLERNTFSYEKIRDLFAKAAENKAIIIFNNIRYFSRKDTYDTLGQMLSNISNTNSDLDVELFEQIKNYPYPIIFTTHNAEKTLHQIDNFRHIVNFIIKFDWLNGSQIRYLYKKTFSYRLPLTYHATKRKHLTLLFFKNLFNTVNLLGLSNNPSEIYRLFKEKSNKNETIYIKRFLAKIFLFILGLSSLFYSIRLIFGGF